MRHPVLRYLCSLIRRQDIRYAIRPLPDHYRGAYHEELGKSPTILIAPHVHSGPVPVLASTIAEEVGHHFRNVPCWWPPDTPEYSICLHYQMQEARAKRWAADHLVNRRMREAARRLGLQTLGELAVFWRVTVEIAAEVVRQDQQTVR